MRTEDYPRELIEQLIPTIFDRTYAWGMTNEAAPDPQMPRGTGLKNRGNTLWAHLADIRRAYAGAELDHRQRVAIVLCGAMGMSQKEAGAKLGVSRQSMQVASDSAVSALYRFLNGSSEDEDWGEVSAVAA